MFVRSHGLFHLRGPYEYAMFTVIFIARKGTRTRPLSHQLFHCSHYAAKHFISTNGYRLPAMVFYINAMTHLNECLVHVQNWVK
jgi:hypothetical protein